MDTIIRLLFVRVTLRGKLKNELKIIRSIRLSRRYGYFIWNAYFLIFLITSASFTTFPIPLAKFDEKNQNFSFVSALFVCFSIQGRVQIACTLLLTSITFRWLCNKALPFVFHFLQKKKTQFSSERMLTFLELFLI